MSEARIDEAGRDAAYAATVARHPDAFVLAVTSAGLFAHLPETFEPGRLRPVMGPRSALDLVVAEDHPVVIDAWHTFIARGVAECKVRPLSAPTQLVELHMIEMSHRYGVPLVLLGGLDGHPAHLPLVQQPIKPRMVTARKSAHAIIVGADPDIVRGLGNFAEQLQ